MRIIKNLAQHKLVVLMIVVERIADLFALVKSLFGF